MTDDIEQIMQEVPGGPNYGRERVVLPTDAEGVSNEELRTRPLDSDAHVRDEFLREGGWTAVDSRRGVRNEGRESGGLTAHRGAIHPGEFIDYEVLVAKLENQLGFTLDEFNSVRIVGRPTGEVRELRLRIEARLAELADAGVNQKILADLLGCPLRKFQGMVAAGRRAQKEGS